MKRYLPVLICTCCFIKCSFGQSASPAEQKEMQAVVVGVFDALSELNVEKAKSYCTPNVSILESGRVWNFDSLALRITIRKAQSPDFKRVNKFQFNETRAYGETAWLSYFNEATISFSGKTVSVKWLESVLLRKIDNQWKIDLLHSTELSRTP